MGEGRIKSELNAPEASHPRALIGKSKRRYVPSSCLRLVDQSTLTAINGEIMWNYHQFYTVVVKIISLYRSRVKVKNIGSLSSCDQPVPI